MIMSPLALLSHSAQNAGTTSHLDWLHRKFDVSISFCFCFHVASSTPLYKPRQYSQSFYNLAQSIAVLTQTLRYPPQSFCNLLQFFKFDYRAFLQSSHGLFTLLLSIFLDLLVRWSQSEYPAHSLLGKLSKLTDNC